MKKYSQMQRFFMMLVFSFLILPALASAHQPRVVEGDAIVVDSPEISKAYYGELVGEPHVYTISSSEAFDLYVNILIPDLADHKRDVSYAVIKNGDAENPVYVFADLEYAWKPMHEFFGNDDYLQGPEYKVHAEAGQYEVHVWSSNNDSKYALAIGEKEFFDFKAIWNSALLIPQIKSSFFEKSGIDTILSPFVLISYGLLILILVILYFIIRKIFKKFKNKN